MGVPGQSGIPVLFVDAGCRVLGERIALRGKGIRLAVKESGESVARELCRRGVLAVRDTGDHGRGRGGRGDDQEEAEQQSDDAAKANRSAAPEHQALSATTSGNSSVECIEIASAATAS